MIVVGWKKSGRIRFVPGITATNCSSSTAEKVTPGSRGSPSCRMKARTSPRTLTVSPGKIDVGRYAGSEEIGSSQFPALMSMGIFAWAGVGIEPITLLAIKLDLGRVGGARYLDSVRIYSVPQYVRRVP